MLNFTHGNLFLDLAGANAAINTVNCRGVMGKGIALEFKRRFPYLFEWYRNECLKGGFRPGDVRPYKIDAENPASLIVFNMATKDAWWDNSEYDWIDVGLENLHDYLRDMLNHSSAVILLPPPGCGNGGLEWSVVKPMVKRHLKDLKCEVRVYEPI